MKLESILRYVIKVAAVMLTSPATWAVAGGLYSDPVQRVIVQIAALILVEGALLLGWHLLDANRQAETAQRWLYASVAIVAYIGLWWLAIAHGEGLSGIVFRATLGVLLVYSMAEAGLLASLRQNRAAERDVMKDGRVLKVLRETQRADAILEIRLNSERTQKRLRTAIAAEMDQDSKRIATAHRQTLRDIAGPDSEGSTPKRATFPYPVKRIHDDRRADRSARLEFIRGELERRPESTASQIVAALMEQTGVKSSTAWEDWSRFQGQLSGVSENNGNGHREAAA